MCECKEDCPDDDCPNLLCTTNLIVDEGFKMGRLNGGKKAKCYPEAEYAMSYIPSKGEIVTNVPLQVSNISSVNLIVEGISTLEEFILLDPTPELSNYHSIIVDVNDCSINGGSCACGVLYGDVVIPPVNPHTFSEEIDDALVLSTFLIAAKSILLVADDLPLLITENIAPPQLVPMIKYSKNTHILKVGNNFITYPVQCGGLPNAIVEAEVTDAECIEGCSFGSCTIDYPVDPIFPLLNCNIFTNQEDNFIYMINITYICNITTDCQKMSFLGNDVLICELDNLMKKDIYRIHDKLYFERNDNMITMIVKEIDLNDFLNIEIDEEICGNRYQTLRLIANDEYDVFDIYLKFDNSNGCKFNVANHRNNVIIHEQTVIYHIR